ncbi:ABC transporter permease [Brassicibacter mesophilus]|uniref:ABC transporter permease n=1 Tax=Brassicibacter mesophilus TaxID=745119 RepID=UPI003D2007CC
MNSFLLGIVQQSLIFSIMVMGVYITYKLLDFPDLSADGTFTLGASVSALLITKGINPFISLIIAVVAGAIAGTCTGLLNVKLKITNLLSGILVMISLYSINLRIMTKANLPLFNYTTMFDDNNTLIIALIFTFITAILFTVFFKTKLGYLIKATGSNENMVVSLGINTGAIKILALSLSNALIALSGAILAQYQGFSDINMGAGTIIMGLASIILADSIFRNLPIFNASIICIVGTILYRASISLSLKLGFNPSDLKLISCIIVIFALSIGHSKFSFKSLNLPFFKSKKNKYASVND